MVYGAEVWQIPTREINKILSTGMDVHTKVVSNTDHLESQGWNELKMNMYKENNGSGREA